MAAQSYLTLIYRLVCTMNIKIMPKDMPTNDIDYHKLLKQHFIIILVLCMGKFNFIYVAMYIHILRT